MVEGLALDVRYAVRALRKSPGFAAVAVVTLTLGIGVNVVAFGLLNAIVLQPLAIHDPGSVYQLRHKPWASFRLITTSYPAFEDYRRRNTTFSEMAAVNGYSQADMTWGSAFRKVHGNAVSGNYFDLLGVRPQLGRFFHGDDERGANSAPYVVLSDGLWRSAFGGERRVIGSTVRLNEQPFTVISVTTPAFHGTERFVWPDYWIPIVNQAQVSGSDFLRRRTSAAVTVIGRLKPGITQKQATENLNAIAAELGREYPQTDDGQPLRLIHPGLFGDQADVIRPFLWGAAALAILVLAAACANLATMFGARAADRNRELALRMALGSGRGRLMGGVLLEAAIVVAMGGGTGTIAAAALLRWISQWESPYGRVAVAVDSFVLSMALVFAVGSAILSSIVPARRAWSRSPMEAMKGSVSGATLPGRLSARDMLLGAQIAICALLVTAALGAARGMVRQINAPLGFQPEGRFVAEVDLSRTGLPDNAAAARREAILTSVRSLTGITAAGMVDRLPMTGGLHGVPVFRPGTAELKLKNSIAEPYLFSVSPGYLEAAGTRLLRGRDITSHDTAQTPPVAIVNEALARKLGTGVIGRFVLSGRLTEVVGVVETGKYHDLQERAQTVAYLAAAQNGGAPPMLLVRSRMSSRETRSMIERQLRDLGSAADVLPWSGTLDTVLFPARAATAATSVITVLAAMLAATGISGLAAYSVSRRRREFGIRVALGARRLQVLRAAVGRVGLLVGAGSAVGVLAGVAAGGWLQQFVDQARVLDPVVVGGATLAMALLGIAAAAAPARTALNADPALLMRDQ